MAKVQSVTSERILKIENAAIVGGTVNTEGNLILSTYDGSFINAGYVKAPSVPQATETVTGTVRYATPDEVVAGVSAKSVVTPRDAMTLVNSRFVTLLDNANLTEATETTAGVVRYATPDEVVDGVSAKSVVTPRDAMTLVNSRFDTLFDNDPMTTGRWGLSENTTVMVYRPNSNGALQLLNLANAGANPIKAIRVILVGGGGAGGGAGPAAAGANSKGGGGGAGGIVECMYATRFFKSMIVGFDPKAGGVGVTGKAGTNGGASTFSVWTGGATWESYAVANGGGAGNIAASHAAMTAAYGGIGGAGSVTGPNYTHALVRNGGTGNNGLGNANFGHGGNGADSPYGGGGRGQYGGGGGGIYPGFAASGAGAGGGGASVNSGGTGTAPGGDGADGLIIAWLYS